MEKLERWYKKYVKVFLWILAIGFVAHAFVITNKLINHDELGQLFDKGGSYSLGRWGLELITYVLPNISMQSLYGIMVLILIGLSSCLISEMFNVESKLLQVIIGGIMITFPSIIGTFSYMFTASSYAVAIFLSVLSVYVISKKNWKIDWIGILCLVLSLSLYQAYISISASLLIILLIKECLKKEKSFKDIIIDAIRYGIFLILSLGIYLIVTKAINKYKEMNFSTYQSVNTMGELSFSLLIQGIIDAYKAIPAMFLINWNGIVYTKLLKGILAIIGIISTIFILYSFNEARKNSILKAFSILILAGMLPMTMNMLFLLNPNGSMHALMIYGNLTLFILPILLYAENKEIKFANYLKNIVIICLSVVIFEYTILANSCYTKLYLAYENTYAFFNTLSTRIQETDGFNQDSKIALIGDFEGAFLNNFDEKFPYTNYITGIKNGRQIIGSYANTNFLKYYIGIDLKFATQDEINKIVETTEYQQMNIYPYDNSIKMFDNIIVVRYK